MANPRMSSISTTLAHLHHPNLAHSLSTTFHSLAHLKATHAHLLLTSRLSDPHTFSRLLAASALSPHSDPNYASLLFSSAPSPSRTLFNTMIRSSVSHPDRTLAYYVSMLRSGIFPDRITFPFLVKSVADSVVLLRGVHCHVYRFGMGSDVFVVNNLISKYSALGDLGSARKVFDECLGVVDVVSWTALVTGFSNAGELGLARWYFDRMPEKNLVSWNSMVSGYARRGRVEDARKLFNEMPERNVASWSSVVSGLAQCRLPKEALRMFREMVGSGVRPNESALVSAVSACAQLRALDEAVWVHGLVRECGVEVNVALGSALVDMYGKCGHVSEALKVFNSMRDRNVYTWNSMIASLAMNGSGWQALTLFFKMKLAGIDPSAVTFIGVLSACSHAGLVQEGQLFFDLMTRVLGIRPMEEHYGCMVDLLGRAGLIEEAVEFMEQMPVEPHAGLLGALVGACRIHGDVERGEKLGKRLIEMEPQHSGRYALLYNLYAAAKRWDAAAMVSKLLKDRGVVKEAGNSSVEQ